MSVLDYIDKLTHEHIYVLELQFNSDPKWRSRRMGTRNLLLMSTFWA